MSSFQDHRYQPTTMAGADDVLAALRQGGTDSLLAGLRSFSAQNPRLDRERERLGELLSKGVALLAQERKSSRRVGTASKKAPDGFVSDTQAKILSLLCFIDRQTGIERIPQPALVAALCLAARDGLQRGKLLPSLREFGRRVSTALVLSEDFLTADAPRLKIVADELTTGRRLSKVLEPKSKQPRKNCSDRVLTHFADEIASAVSRTYGIPAPSTQDRRLGCGGGSVTVGGFSRNEYLIAYDIKNIRNYRSPEGVVYELLDTVLHEARHAFQWFVADAYAHAAMPRGHTRYQASRGYGLAASFPHDAAALFLAGYLSADGQPGVIEGSHGRIDSGYAIYQSVLWERDARAFADSVYSELATRFGWPGARPVLALAEQSKTTASGLILPSRTDVLLYASRFDP